MEREGVIMFKRFFKDSNTEVKEVKKEHPIMVDEYTKITLMEKLPVTSITTDKLFNLTQEVKNEIGYKDLPRGDKYLVDQFQDILIYLVYHTSNK